MSLTWNLVGNFNSSIIGLTQFNIQIITNKTPPYIASSFSPESVIINSAFGGSISVELLDISEYNNNDNKYYPDSLIQTFSSEGLSFQDKFNRKYNFSFSNGNNTVTNTFGDNNVTITLTEACLLDNTKILNEKNEYVPITSLKIGDKIISSLDKKLMEITLITKSHLNLDFLPYNVFIENMIEPLYCSVGHSIYFNGKWGSAKDFGFFTINSRRFKKIRL